MRLSKSAAIATGIVALIYSVAAAAVPTTDSKQGPIELNPATSTGEQPASDKIAWPWPPICPPFCVSEMQSEAVEKRSIE